MTDSAATPKARLVHHLSRAVGKKATMHKQILERDWSGLHVTLGLIESDYRQAQEAVTDLMTNSNLIGPVDA